MARLRQAGLQCRNLRGGLVGGLAGLLGFQRGGQTGLHPPFGDLLGLLLQRQVLLGNAQTVLLAAQFHIGLGHFGRQRHLGAFQRGLGRAGRGFAGVDPVALRAPPVRLPAGVQPGGIAVARVVIALAAAPHPGTGAGAGQQAGGLHIARGPGLAHGRLGAQQAGVGLQGLVDQGRQLGIAKALPPAREVFRRLLLGCRLGGMPCRGHRRHGACRGEGGGVAAAGQQQGAGQGHRQRQRGRAPRRRSNDREGGRKMHEGPGGSCREL